MSLFISTKLLWRRRGGVDGIGEARLDVVKAKNIILITWAIKTERNILKPPVKVWGRLGSYVLEDDK